MPKRLSPIARALDELERDYKEMETMFYRSKRPDWDLILKTIEKFEREFNAQKEATPLFGTISYESIRANPRLLFIGL